jgi:threonine dehydrogenase-like Zn-dependent dehydrogenase
MWGHSPAGLFGYSHILGGFPGGQAEYLRVPYADVGPIKVPDELSNEQALFLSDIFPTGYMAAEFCNIQGGETIAIWGCGPAVNSRSKVLSFSAPNASSPSIRFPSGFTQTLDFMKENIYEAIQDKTQGRGADACIDAVGTEPDTMASWDSMIPACSASSHPLL